MKPVLLWTPQAREDLLDIYVTIGSDSPAAADRMYTAFEDRVTLFETSPRMGARRPEIAAGASVLVEGMYLIFYETHPNSDEGPLDSVEIVRLVHGQRDLSRVF